MYLGGKNMYVKDFNKIPVKRMKEILKEVSKEDMNKWDVVTNSKGLFITNDFFSQTMQKHRKDIIFI